MHSSFINGKNTHKPDVSAIGINVNPNRIVPKSSLGKSYV
jgi:hypothetical protein